MLASQQVRDSALEIAGHALDGDLLLLLPFDIEIARQPATPPNVLRLLEVRA